MMTDWFFLFIAVTAVCVAIYVEHRTDWYFEKVLPRIFRELGVYFNSKEYADIVIRDAGIQNGDPVTSETANKIGHRVSTDFDEAISSVFGLKDVLLKFWVTTPEGCVKNREVYEKYTQPPPRQTA